MMATKRSGEFETIVVLETAVVNGKVTTLEKTVAVIEGAACPWPRRERPGNLEQVRAALHGITGIEAKPSAPDRYVVSARIGQELDTVDSLRRKVIAAYWPSYERLVTTNQRLNGHPVRRMKRFGMIPGYVFSPLDPKLDFQQLLETVVGAFDIVRTFSGQPWLIPDADIRLIRDIEIGMNAPLPDGKVEHDFKRGQKVRFVDDLVGRWPPGKIDKLERDGRISVEVDLMGRKVPITVLPHQIERT